MGSDYLGTLSLERDGQGFVLCTNHVGAGDTQFLMQSFGWYERKCIVVAYSGEDFCYVWIMDLEINVTFCSSIFYRFLQTGNVEWMNVKHIPVRGKHLDDFTPKDHLFIGISKAQTGPFLYLLLRYCFYEANVIWTFEEGDFSLKTILLPLPVLFIVYDFFYTLLHGFLHINTIYPLIHKHHHVQKAPSRATDDAVNVHPIEFTLGEYNHLFTIFLCCRVANLRMHILAPLLFLGIGGILAGWNHTRFDLTFKLFGVTVFDSKAHDVHHRIPQSNYGQYTMFWDYMFGTYRSYDPTDRVNPKAQLDPKTGKSLNYDYIKARSTK
jgi:sterol desaturase/sphingolipid hydroxylase (fatty acid hydroxylase superfamily)